MHVYVKEGKDAREIYEGDIVKYGAFALNDTVSFGETPHKNLPKGIKENDITTQLGVFEAAGDIYSLNELNRLITENPDVVGVEIIGNIYENPELLHNKTAP